MGNLKRIQRAVCKGKAAIGKGFCELTIQDSTKLVIELGKVHSQNSRFELTYNRHLKFSHILGRTWVLETGNPEKEILPEFYFVFKNKDDGYAINAYFQTEINAENIVQIQTRIQEYCKTNDITSPVDPIEFEVEKIFGHESPDE